MTRDIRLGSRRVRLPDDHRLRIGLGLGLVIGGVLGFLPVLGFWMVPLGLLVLSQDIPAVRRFRRRVQVWWERRRRPVKRPAGPRRPRRARRPRDAADSGTSRQ
jgi:hypothetical protein